jgi:hypothetical protein
LRLPPLCVLLLPFLLLGCRGSAPVVVSEADSSKPNQGFWDHWGDGRAELSGYRLTQPRYGEQRSGEAILITVTEDFTRAGRVKTDGGHYDEYPVIKLNEIRDWQTGIYDYNVMTSTFLPLDGSTRRGLPTKISFSSQEWCGHIWEQLRITGSAAGRTLHSYFDGEADHYESLPIPEGGYFADTLPLLVRGLVGDIIAPGESIEVPWLRSALARRLNHEHTLWVRATISRSADTQILKVPAGQFEVESWRATDPRSTTTWYVEAKGARRLIAWEVSDGERAELTGSVRSSYWNKNAEGDEVLRAQLGLRPLGPTDPGAISAGEAGAPPEGPSPAPGSGP